MKEFVLGEIAMFLIGHLAYSAETVSRNFVKAMTVHLDPDGGQEYLEDSWDANVHDHAMNDEEPPFSGLNFQQLSVEPVDST